MLFIAPIVALASVATAIPAGALVGRASDLSSDILANITQLRSDIKTLNNSLNAQSSPDGQYTFFQLLAIQGNANTLAGDINSTAGTANASSVWTSSESQAIYSATNNDLKPDIFSLLDNFIYHYPGFKSGGIASTVETSLQNQQELSRELGNALVAKAVEPYADEGATTSGQIQDKFNQAIQKFSS